MILARCKKINLGDRWFQSQKVVTAIRERLRMKQPDFQQDGSFLNSCKKTDRQVTAFLGDHERSNAQNGTS